MPPSTLQAQIIASAKRFPKDLLRPEIDFGAVVLELANERFAALESQGRSHQLNRSDERLLMNVQIGLRSLIDNDWRKKYPLTEKTLKPASDPLYYYRIADAVDRATSEKGPKAKSWWRTFFALEAEGFKEKVRSGVLDERIGLPPRAVKTEGKAETAETN